MTDWALGEQAYVSALAQTSYDYFMHDRRAEAERLAMEVFHSTTDTGTCNHSTPETETEALSPLGRPCWRRRRRRYRAAAAAALRVLKEKAGAEDTAEASE